LTDFDKIYTAVTATKFVTKCYHLHTYFVNSVLIMTSWTPHWQAATATASYQRVVWTGTAHCGWCHWSMATLSVSLCRRWRWTLWT